MKRRSFLTTAAATGAAAITGPAWVERAFAQDDLDDPAAQLSALSAAYRAAQRGGRPLLVLVIPEDGGRRYARGHAFGELLNHGGDAVFADLALAEVACASLPILRRLVPQVGASSPDAEPWMVVVETDRHPAVVTRLEGELPDPPTHWGHEGTPEEYDREVDRAIDARMAALSQMIHGALAADDAMISARARVAEAHVAPATARQVMQAARRGTLTAAMAERAPALARAASLGSDSLVEAARDALAAGARARLTEHRVAGSYWASSWGCGVTVEGRDDNMMIGCGMGHVPERSRRFLYWMTR